MKYLNKPSKYISGSIGALALGLSLSFGGCDEKNEKITFPQPYTGTIWEKRHYPEKENIRMESTDAGLLSKRVPIYAFDDEDFIFEVMRKNKDDLDNKTLYVDKKTFDTFDIGDKFLFDYKNAEEFDPESWRTPTKKELEKCAEKIRFGKICKLN